MVFPRTRIETLRKYPILPLLNRECTKRYPIPGTDIVLEKGTGLIIPIFGLQRDPTYYPEPDEFRPERFLNKNAKNRLDQPYMPFGEGPRICIGLRLGIIQVKVGLMMMLQRNSFHLQNEAEQQLELSARSLIMSTKGGINLTVKKR